MPAFGAACALPRLGCVEFTPDLSEVLAANDPGIPVTGDSDFGAAPLLFHPDACPSLAAANNKDGALYVWNRGSLSDGPLLRLPLSDGIAPFVGAPAWSQSQQMIYVGQSVIRSDGQRLGNGVTAWHLDQGLRLPADLAGLARRWQPGDAARRRERPVRDRRTTRSSEPTPQASCMSSAPR